MMRRIGIIIAFLAFFFIMSPTWAAGGPCPTGANYLNSSGSFVTLGSLSVTNCYFILATGLDTNTGTDETHPWLHSPGMATCTSSCFAVTPSAGVGFIFRGCGTWGNSNLPILWNWSGSSGSPTYIGVDQTWYNTTNCSSTWNRPAWDAQKVALSAPYLFNPSSSSATSYVTLDNMEMRGLYVANASPNSEFIDNARGGSTNWTFSSRRG